MRADRRRRSLTIAAVAAAGGLLLPHAAFASASVSNGRYSCTVTARPASLVGTTLSARAWVSCTSATTVGVYLGVSEMDGTVEQVVQAPQLQFVAVTQANTAFPVYGKKVTCVSTEAGNEEYASKASVSLTTSTGTTVTSAWDLKVPMSDTYAC